jgi:hypothetical protein
MNQENNPREAGASALKQARAASRRGDLAAAERWSKSAERMAAAAEKLANLPPPPDSWENEEALRAELRRRLDVFIKADQEQEQWESRRDAHAQASAAALAEGREPPPPMEAFGPNGPPHDLERLARWTSEVGAPGLKP